MAGKYTIEQELEMYGHRASISVVPELFGKEPDQARTTWAVRKWCQDNLKSYWTVKATRRLLWSTEVSYFDIITMDKAEAQKANDFFNHPKV